MACGKDVSIIFRMKLVDTIDNNGNYYPRESIEKALKENNELPLLVLNEQSRDRIKIGNCKLSLDDDYIVVECTIDTAGTYEIGEITKSEDGEYNIVNDIHFKAFTICMNPIESKLWDKPDL